MDLFFCSFFLSLYPVLMSYVFSFSRQRKARQGLEKAYANYSCRSDPYWDNIWESPAMLYNAEKFTFTGTCNNLIL